MRFFIGKKQISFEDFKLLRPSEAELLKGHLELPVDFELDQNDGLFLLSETTGPMGIDVPKMMSYHRQFFFKHSVYDQPLAKALGLKRGKDRPVIMDATAGVLKDSCLMAAMGLTVFACERHPVAQALITNALLRSPMANLSFAPMDASKFIRSVDFENVNSIYFDPMYENPSKKSAPRKEMRIFREVVLPDMDAKEIAQLLLSSGKRLVIKRPAKSAKLLDTPQITFGKKSTHYDVYLKNLQ